MNRSRHQQHGKACWGQMLMWFVLLALLRSRSLVAISDEMGQAGITDLLGKAFQERRTHSCGRTARHGPKESESACYPQR